MSSLLQFAIGFYFLLFLQIQNASSIDYGLALTKSLLYFEAQRSGKLPTNQRVQWRADSALTDGKVEGVDLIGGYYDAGDNVKFGFPMAFTVTMLAWSVTEFGEKIKAKNELTNALEAIKWGTEYFIKAHPQPNLLYGEVGDGDSDHDCWQRPEDMTTPRNAYQINETHPGSDLAAETAAAFAAASLAFKTSDSAYSNQLITHAEQLFDFADKYRAKYQDSISVAKEFYTSSDFEDELIWAAAWLYRATLEGKYRDYISRSSSSNGGVRSSFSWDDKYLGAQVLVTQSALKDKFSDSSGFDGYKKNAEAFICNCIQKGTGNLKMTEGGLLWTQDFNNLQFVTTASFAILSYAELLVTGNMTLSCSAGVVSSQDLVTFVQSQVDYILGNNPTKTSYMVGYGSNYPQKVHHRGASIVSIKKNSTAVTCKGGYELWQKSSEPNPNVIEGAIVGGPDLNDLFNDSRDNFHQNEPATANTAPLVGVLAYFA